MLMRKNFSCGDSRKYFNNDLYTSIATQIPGLIETETPIL